MRGPGPKETDIKLIKVITAMEGEARGWVVPKPHYSARPLCFGSRGPSLSPRIRHRSALTEKAWENAVQLLGNYEG